MAYPRHVTLEFCHRHHTWRAYGERRPFSRSSAIRTIVAFDHDENRLKEICPNHTRISPKDTGVKNACMCTAC